MAALRSRNAVVLYKEEVTEGVDPTPAAGTDAVLVEDVSLDFNPTIVQTNEVTGSVDSRGPITGGIPAQDGAVNPIKVIQVKVRAEPAATAEYQIRFASL